MTKIQRISEEPLRLNFHSPTESFEVHFAAFLKTDLGKIYQAIPWKALIKEFRLKPATVGRKGHFSPQGKLALMFLKHYSCLSDRKLIEFLNGNIHWQLFCGILIAPQAPIVDFKIVSKIRCQLSKPLGKKLNQVQEVLAKHWKPHMEQTNVVLVDATCYESSVRYPTDQKLLWESVEWTYELLQNSCRSSGIRTPRTKYLKWESRYHNYSRMRKKRRKKRRSLTRGLLRLLEKILGELQALESARGWEPLPGDQKRLRVIEKVFKQQYAYFYHGTKPKGRLISLAKPYLRPIVRGKEVKGVEFGAKVNKIQIDGINFIETFSFHAFNEGTRLQNSVFLARRFTGRVDVVGADSIYASNKNRKYCTQNHIATDFKRKGRAGKYEEERKLLAKNVTKERASRLEGSFGTEKNHYLLHRIGARTADNERLWIFMGIHTANALKIGRRMVEKELKAAA